jgi:hypothetical protein
MLPDEYLKALKMLPEKSINTIATDIFEIEKIEELENYFPKESNK